MKYFITESYLKTFTPYNLNIDMNKIDYSFKLIFDTHICELLGNHFANYLLDKHQLVADGTQVYTSYEERVVDYLQDIMSWNVAITAMIEIADQITNVGVVQGITDNTTISSASAHKTKQDYYKNNVNSYVTKLSKYLCANKENIPQYKTELNDDSIIKNNCGCCNGLGGIIDIGIDII